MNHDLKDFLAQLLNGEGLTEDQSEYLGIPIEGPYKNADYRY